MAKNEKRRPQSMSTCIAVAKCQIDAFARKSIVLTKLRRDTERRAKFYAEQMDCSVEQLSEALLEYFVWCQMESQSNSNQELRLFSFNEPAKKVMIQQYDEDEMEPQLGVTSFFE